MNQRFFTLLLTALLGFSALCYGAETPSRAELLKQYTTEGSQKVLKAYVATLTAGDYNDTQRLIFLRDALAEAKSNADKCLLLGAIGECQTIQALYLAGEYLTAKPTQKPATKAALGILLQDTDYRFWGVETEHLAEKLLLVCNGAERAALEAYLAKAPTSVGFYKAFNGKDLTGWKGLVLDPIKRAKLTQEALAKQQAKADEHMRENWSAVEGELRFSGKGANICTAKPYGDFEMYVDWRIGKEGDSGIYLRGTPQVQIWDIARVRDGAQVGSGGLYNNRKNRIPLQVADHAVGEWNTFYIKMVGERVTVYLNGILVVDNIVMENFWDRKQPIFPVGEIELQAHGELIAFRDIFIKEL